MKSVLLASSLLFGSAVLGAPSTSTPVEIRNSNNNNGIDKRDITAQEFSSLGLFAQYAAAAQCNYGNTPGQFVVCGGGACPLVQASQATTVVSFT